MKIHINSLYTKQLRIAAYLSFSVAGFTTFAALIFASKEQIIGAIAMSLCSLVFAWFLIKRSRGEAASIGVISVSDRMNESTVAENDSAAIWLTVAYSVLLLFMLGVFLYR